MMRKVVAAVIVLLLGAMSAEATQAKAGSKCSGKQVRGMFCEKDGTLVNSKELKAGKHATCGSKAVQVAVCVKKTYVCAGQGDKNCGAKSDVRGSCKCKKSMKAVDGEPSLVKWKCSGCDQEAFVRNSIQHDKEKDKTAKRKAVTSACSH